MNINNYKSFEELENSVKQLNIKWGDLSKNRNKELTFAGIQNQLQSNYLFITNERKMLDEDILKLKDVWSNKVVAEHKENLIKQFDELVKKIIETAKQDIVSFTSSKLEKIYNMLITAPTEEQLRLLSALQMRGDIDPVEVHHILPVFFQNYQAMKILGVISEKSGITLNLPVQLDCRTMYKTLDEASDYLINACDELCKKWDNVNIKYRAFYTSNSKEKDKQYDPLYQQYINLFDSTPQLQDCKTEKEHLSQSEKVRIDWYFKDVATLNPSDLGDDIAILRRVKEVMDAHPDMIQLLKLSTYKKYVTEIETNK